MNTSEQINDLAAALVKAQGVMKNAALNKVNPHFRSKYADLAGIRDTVVPVLTQHGIAVTQTLDSDEGQMVVHTRLLHTSGQWIEGACPIPMVPDMQKMGSAITYARRYSLSAICGIAADEDDDAHAASEKPNGKPVAVAKAPAGYNDWLIDLEATAQNGSEALKAAWQKSKPELRTHLTTTDNAKWEALKAKAAKVQVSA